MPVMRALWSLRIPVFTIPGWTELMVTFAFLACQNKIINNILIIINSKKNNNNNILFNLIIIIIIIILAKK